MPWTNQAVTLIVLSAGATGFSGLFAYSPPPGPGNLIASITATSGTDLYGNAYQGGITSYGGSGLLSELLQGMVVLHDANGRQWQMQAGTNSGGSFVSLQELTTSSPALLINTAGNVVSGAGSTIPEIWHPLALNAGFGPGAFSAPALVQSVTGAFNTATGTLTLPSPTRPGNTLIVCLGTDGTVANPVLTGITLGGVPGNFAGVASETSGFENCYIWAAPNITGGQTAVAFSTISGAGTLNINVTVMEWSGLAPFAPNSDATGANFGNAATTPWTVTSSASTQTEEVVIGTTFARSTSPPVFTGPGAPWTNISGTPGSTCNQITGWQVVAATGTFTYNGTATPSPGAFASCIATFKAAGTPSYRVEAVGSAGLVRLSDLVALTANQVAGAAIATLPAAYRPPRTKNLIAANNLSGITNSNTTLTVSPAGVVALGAAGTSGNTISLDGVTYALD